MGRQIDRYDERKATTRFRWQDTGEPVEGGPLEPVDEATRRLGMGLQALSLKGEAMLIGEMGGFVASLVVYRVYREPVPLSDWMPHVWGQDMEIDNADQAAEEEAALIRHHNWAARTLAFEPERYAPVLEMDEARETVFW